MRAEGLQNSRESCVESTKQSAFKRDDAVVQPIVVDPVDDDTVTAGTGAGMILAPSELRDRETETRVDTSHSNHGAHRASKAKDTLKNRAYLLKTANFPLLSVFTLF